MSTRLAYYNKTNRTKSVSVTKALAAAVMYTAGDVMSESASAGTIWTFDGMVGKLGGSGEIVKAIALCETTGIVPALILYLFRAAPTSQLNDNIANTAVLHADAANFVGSISFPVMEDHGTGDSQSIATPGESAKIPMKFKCAAADDALYGVLVDSTGVTVVATNDMIITLTSEPD